MAGLFRYRQYPVFSHQSMITISIVPRKVRLHNLDNDLVDMFTKNGFQQNTTSTYPVETTTVRYFVSVVLHQTGMFETCRQN